MQPHEPRETVKRCAVPRTGELCHVLTDFLLICWQLQADWSSCSGSPIPQTLLHALLRTCGSTRISFCTTSHEVRPLFFCSSGLGKKPNPVRSQFCTSQMHHVLHGHPPGSFLAPSGRVCMLSATSKRSLTAQSVCFGSRNHIDERTQALLLRNFRLGGAQESECTKWLTAVARDLLQPIPFGKSF